MQFLRRADTLAAMRAAYLLNITLHVLAAMFWLGGMFFLGLIGAPVLRAVEPASLRQRLFNDLGLRFRTAGWIAIAGLLVTGVLNLWFRGWLRWDGVLGSSAFWASATGRVLALKLTTVTVILVIAAVHDFALGPTASRAEAGSDAAVTARRRAAWLARVNALVGTLLLVAAVRLARG
jgi:uncharacterized membrane protein